MKNLTFKFFKISSIGLLALLLTFNTGIINTLRAEEEEPDYVVSEEDMGTRDDYEDDGEESDPDDGEEDPENTECPTCIYTKKDKTCIKITVALKKLTFKSGKIENHEIELSVTTGTKIVCKKGGTDECKSEKCSA